MPLRRRRLLEVAMPLAMGAALPAVSALALLAALGQAGWGVAILGIAASVPVSLGLGVVFAIRLRRMGESIEALADPAIPVSPTPTGRVLAPIGAAVLRLEQGLRRERVRHEAAAAANAAIVEGLPDALVVLDRERRVTGANAEARRTLGAGAVGHDLAYSLRHAALLEAVDAALKGAGAEQALAINQMGPPARHFSVRVAALPGGGASAAVVVLHDVTDTVRAEAMRADFVANASHELRTPLASLVGMIETLQGPAKDDVPARQRFLGVMHEQAARMTRLVNDLLSLSRIEAREHELPRDRVDMAALVREVAGLLQLEAEKRGMSIVVDAAADSPPVLGARDELTQVAQNLMDNAIRYGRPGTPVRVRVAPQAEGGRRTVEVTVSDQGDGIAPEHLPRLTERFYRADSARSRALGGTGLGLAIVKHALIRHRGRLDIRSTVGEGSTFRVTLPAHE
jgi:two-component system, OmpR family, phosphate regulon sensor histidine kinase PhoR